MQHLCCTDASWKTTASGYHDTGTWQALQFGGERVDGRILTATQHAWTPVAELPVHGVKASPQMCRYTMPIFMPQTPLMPRVLPLTWLIRYW